ncbi:peroxidase 1-like [Phragmites australis]|uniref:peroxidase 1-like n=1 Tax=Phragmites australis TaxID=29695 RepID=UPI002D78F935|nr:peroxidase 1-like [Phragmites australis]
MMHSVLFRLFFGFALPLVLRASSLQPNPSGLTVGFYQYTCPNAEAIVRDEMAKIISIVPSLAGPLLRMHFHDCFVNGCDGSVLLNSTPGSPSEKESVPNLSLRGFGTIDRVKAKLEQACPGVVSCADVLALVARDVVVLTKGPHWDVPTGRRDGRRSVKDEALNNLPPPFFDAGRNLYQFFIPKGLDAKDQVVLLGGHTLGTSHCSSFADRLYNFTGTLMPDPSLDKRYLPKLKSKCVPGDAATLVEMDPGSFRTFDASYYRHVAKGRSLFTSDQTLMNDPAARDYVQRQAAVADAGTYPAEFFADFAASMVKMGNMQVLTGAQGEVRRHCAFVN